MQTAILFPGQGSQFCGMGKELYESFQEAKEVYQEVDEILKQKLSKIIFSDDLEALTLTSNTQPAIMATSIAVLRVLEKQGKLSVTDLGNYSAGHSLGEYSALCAAQAFSLSDTAKLLRIRGDSMQKAVPVGKGGMVALVGTTLENCEKLVAAAKSNGVCNIANDNGAGQIVISGAIAAMQFCLENYKNFAIKRAISLPVSAPFHSDMMKPAADAMAKALAETTINLPLINVFSNVSTEVYNSADQIRNGLVEQVCGQVRWRETMEKFYYELKIECFIEIGPGKVLNNMGNKMFTNIKTFNILTPQDIEIYIENRSK